MPLLQTQSLRRSGSRARRGGIPALPLIAASLGAALLAASCGESTVGAPSGKKTLQLAVIPKGTTHVFWQSIHAGALLGAKEIGAEKGVEVRIDWQGPLVEDEKEGQRQVVETFAGQNIDGIVLAPIDEHALVGPVNQAMAAGKPVVIIDSGLKGGNYVSFVATNNYKGGVLAAERLGELLSGKGKALLLRYQIGSASTDQREQGFIDTMKAKFPDIELLPPGLEQYAGATVGRSQEASETLLNAYTDIDGIFCPNESSATGMLQALQKTGRAGKIFFVGFDANETLVAALRGKEGGAAGAAPGGASVHGLILQNPIRMGNLGVQTMVRHLLGEKVEKEVDTGVYLITRENMDEPENHKLLEPDLSILKG